MLALRLSTVSLLATANLSLPLPPSHGNNSHPTISKPVHDCVVNNRTAHSTIQHVKIAAVALPEPEFSPLVFAALCKNNLMMDKAFLHSPVVNKKESHLANLLPILTRI
ncbi:hypothetical protein J6590_027327 [Homalodisca vitripennis]|nr:hypothetical protein J6590_027327 [Homalodisca vitripennis]